MKLTYTGTEPAAVPDARLLAEPGQTYEIPEELASSLIERGQWKRAKQPVKEA